jgi:hypothetical protein
VQGFLYDFTTYGGDVAGDTRFSVEGLRGSPFAGTSWTRTPNHFMMSSSRFLV